MLILSNTLLAVFSKNFIFLTATTIIIYWYSASCEINGNDNFRTILVSQSLVFNNFHKNQEPHLLEVGLSAIGLLIYFVSSNIYPLVRSVKNKNRLVSQVIWHDK